MLTLVTTVNYLLWKAEGAEHTNFAIAFTLVSVWILGVQMPYRLRVVEVDEAGLLLKRAGRQEFIPYADIHWLTRFDVLCPWFITMKYHDPQRGDARKIAYIPQQPYKSVVRQDEMTAYIKEQVKTRSRYYSAESQPVAWRNFILITLFGSPMLLVLLYAVKQLVDK